jgi:hypothetical protein
LGLLYPSLSEERKAGLVSDLNLVARNIKSCSLMDREKDALPKEKREQTWIPHQERVWAFLPCVLTHENGNLNLGV